MNFNVRMRKCCLCVLTGLSCCCRVPSQLDMLAASMTNLMLTLGDVAAVNGLDLPVGDGVVENAVEVAESTGNRGGFFGPVANFLEACLKVSPRNVKLSVDPAVP